MKKEIDLLVDYPKAKRDVKSRGATKTEEDRSIARQFGKDFFDGDRKHGYGGYNYHPRFWQPVVPTFKEFYQLNETSKILDVGCGKGFMLYDFIQHIPGIHVQGIDISQYAIAHAKQEVKPYLQVANAMNLPFEDNTFDLVISINTVHNLEQNDLIKALKEMQRVSKKHSYITVDAYRDEEEKELMFDWNLTAKTILHVQDWKSLFHKIGFEGDYYWFIP